MFFGIEKVSIGDFLLCAAVIFINVFVWIKLLRNAMQKRKKALKELQEPLKDMPLVSKKAIVLSKKADIKYGRGIKLPVHNIVYSVIFSVDGKHKEFEVPKEVFESVSETQSGKLVTQNGIFYDFQKK